MNWNVQALTGDLDPDFGRGGKVTTDFFGDNDEALGLVVQPDGKTIVAGFARSNNRLTFFAMSRYNPDGSPDSSFGDGGKVTTDSFWGFTSGKALALQPDGKLLVGGAATLGASVTGFALARFNEDGSLDKSFGTDGQAVAAILDQYARVEALHVLPDGKILAAGTASPITSLNDFAVARFNSDGSLDTTFGIDGRVITNFLGSSDSVRDMLVQPDGKIVVVGIAFDPVSNEKWALARYNSNGSLDAGFGSQGKVAMPIGEGSREANAVALQPDGKIVVGGCVYRKRPADSMMTQSIVPPRNEDLAIARYNKDGSLDSSFGEGGILLRDIGIIDRVKDLSIQPDDKIIIAGFTTGKPPSDYPFPVDFGLVLSRYNPDGSLDIDFKPAESGDAPVQYS